MNKTIDRIFFALLFIFALVSSSSVMAQGQGAPKLKLARGDFFGELALIEDAPRSADVIAVDDILALTIGRAAFTKLLRSEAALTPRKICSRVCAATSS